MSAESSSVRGWLRRFACAASVLAGAVSILSAQSTPGTRTTTLSSDTVRSTVMDLADIVGREYMDAAAAVRIADAMRRRVDAGEYASLTAPDTLAARLTRDLLTESQDKHLAVALVRASSPAAPATTKPSTREEDVRRTNGGVERVEILPGNVGYLNLTSFWRMEEAREPIGTAMSLLQRADALIIDMRENGGGSPETVAFLMGFLFDAGGLPVFDIVSRSGNVVSYATPASAPAERDPRRSTQVLTSSRTFSAGEGFPFLLQERRRAEIVGERTAGAANPGRPYRVSELFEVTVPNGKVRSAVVGGNWEGRGVTPDIEVAAADALRVAHSRTLKRLLEAAEGEWRVRLERILQSLGASGRP